MDGVDGTLRQLIRKLPKELSDVELNGKGNVEYYFSGKKADENERKVIERYLEQLSKVEK
mgnify:CR=1 FL=1